MSAWAEKTIFLKKKKKKKKRVYGKKSGKFCITTYVIILNRMKWNKVNSRHMLAIRWEVQPNPISLTYMFPCMFFAALATFVCFEFFGLLDWLCNLRLARVIILVLDFTMTHLITVISCGSKVLRFIHLNV